MRNLIITVSAWMFTAFAAEAQFSVNGLVTDSLGEEIPFSTVRVYSPADTVKVVAMGVGNEDGIFKLNLPAAGDYMAVVSSTGMKSERPEFAVTDKSPSADLGRIVLSPENSLGEVVLTAQRPVITREIDRIGYDVQADPEAATSQLDEMLKKVPLVTVDSDGNITIKGQSDFKIYKNGRPNNSFTKNAKDIFKAIPASMIKKIEVITDPGTREDAEGVGAILNIVTLENTTIRGVTGSTGLSISNQALIPMPYLWLTSQIDKVTFAVSGGGQYSTQDWASASNTETLYPDETLLTQSSRDRSRFKYFYGGGELSWEIDTLNLISGEFQFYKYSDPGSNFGSTASSLHGNPLYSYSQKQSSSDSYLDFDGNVNYQHSTKRKDESVTLSYAVSTTRQTRDSETEYLDLFNVSFPYDRQSVNSHLRFIEQTVQLDWTRPINEISKFDVGGKFIHRDNHTISDNSYLGEAYDRRDETDFSHTTLIGAIYADYRVKYKKVGARAGLRYEYSRLSATYHDDKGKDFGSSLNDVVPTVSFNWSPTDVSTFKATYSNTIRRPGINSLNPEINETPLTWSQGNPDLKSSRNHNISAEYSFMGQKVSIESSLYTNFSNNAVISTRWLDGDVTCSSYANQGSNRRYGANLWMNWRLGAKTSIMFSGQGSRVIERNPSLNVGVASWYAYGFLRLEQKLPADFTVYLWGNGNTPYRSIYSRYKLISSGLSWGFSVNKSMLKDKRLTFRINVSNLGRSKRRWASESLNMPYRQESWGYSAYATYLNFGVSYRFGSLNASVKKTKSSIENTDLESKKM